MILPRRKTPRLVPGSYHGCRLYFVTLCCHKRRRVFEKSSRCQWLLDVLRVKAALSSFNVLAYCIMPDHCHFLFEGVHESCNLLRLIKSLKITTSRIFWEQEKQFLWQHAYFEHILRRPEEIQSVAWYIWLNPVRRGLASIPQEYMFAGSFTGLRMPESWRNADWKPEWKRKPL